MINESLKTLKKVIYNYLVNLPEIGLFAEDSVKLSPVVKIDGSQVEQTQDNSLLITLVRVEEERIIKEQNFASITSDGQVAKINPGIKLNLFILFSASCKDYGTGLKFISGVVRCFQSNNVFTKSNTPEMDSSLQKLIVELYTLNFEEQNHLWGALGAKYVPSVLYKVRLLTVKEDKSFKVEPQINKFELGAGST